MKTEEKAEIQQLPAKYRPMGAWTYFGLSVLFAIPVIGLIFLIVFACDGSHVNRRSYARSFFCVYILIAVLVFAYVISGASLMGISRILSLF